MPTPQIAIIDANTLACIGLRSVIERLIPIASVNTFSSFQSMKESGDAEHYFHYFVSLQILLEQTQFFLQMQHKTVILISGAASASLIHKGFHTLNISQPEGLLIKQILKLHQSGHGAGHGHHPIPLEDQQTEKATLSKRESEVLVCVVKGLLNKEIADKLNISLPTVISHRKNIVEKLGIRSVSGLTIYAVMQGYIEANDI